MFEQSATSLLDPPSLRRPKKKPVAPTVPRNDDVAPAEPVWINRGQIPGLDGLRAVAVILVLMTHACQTAGFPRWTMFRSMLLRGEIGVDIFFVISGFLITTLLLRELERAGEVNLKRFYLRRGLRIMPAYLCLLAVVAIGQSTGYFQLRTRDWIAASTYTMNFLHHPTWALGHCWSLSIEEHFYLLWPFVLFAGGAVWGWRVGLCWVAGCWLIRCAIAFGASHYLFPASSEWSSVTLTTQMAENWTFTRLDTITLGSLLALACRSVQGRAWLDWATRPWFVALYLFVMAGAILSARSAKFNLCVAYTLNGVCITLLVWWLVQSKGTISRILSHPLLRTVGYGSYSLYLWQQLFLYPRHAGWIHQFPQNLGLVFIAAFLSFWLIERPMNQLKDRVAA